MGTVRIPAPAAGVLIALALLAGPPCSAAPADPYAQALARHRAGDLEGAVRGYREVIAAQPRHAAARANLGAALAALGRYGEAVRSYEEALELRPGDAGVRLNLALAFYKSADLPRAAEVLEGLQADPAVDSRATLLLADCRLQMGEYDRVEALLRPLEQMRPGDRAVLYMLGMALVRGGKPEEGQARIDRLMRGGDSAEAQYLLGSAAFTGEDYPRAVGHLGRALALQPGLPALRSYYGRALLFTGDAEAAERVLREAVAAEPNDHEAHYHLASILSTLGRVGEARPFAERARELRPGSEAARELLAGLDRPGAGRAPDPSPLLGLPAPEITLLRPGGGTLRLSSLRGRPVLLVFGSYTCPQLRHGIPHVNRLHARYGGQVAFLMAYIREAHPRGEAWPSTINEREGISLLAARSGSEREGHAEACRRALEIPFEVLADGMGAEAEAAYGAFPSRAFVIDAGGTVTFSAALDRESFDPRALEAAVAAVAH
jgi:Flp pilus assembly protein TadD/thiol-disulfide isomerase/thioredoxin